MENGAEEIVLPPFRQSADLTLLLASRVPTAGPKSRAAPQKPVRLICSGPAKINYATRIMPEAKIPELPAEILVSRKPLASFVSDV